MFFLFSLFLLGSGDDDDGGGGGGTASSLWTPLFSQRVDQRIKASRPSKN